MNKETINKLAEPSDETPLRKIATELLRLYDWEIVHMLSRPLGSDESVRAANREKAAAWDALRKELDTQPVVQEKTGCLVYGGGRCTDRAIADVEEWGIAHADCPAPVVSPSSEPLSGLPERVPVQCFGTPPHDWRIFDTAPTREIRCVKDHRITSPTDTNTVKS